MNAIIKATKKQDFKIPTKPLELPKVPKKLKFFNLIERYSNYNRKIT